MLIDTSAHPVIGEEPCPPTNPATTPLAEIMIYRATPAHAVDVTAMVEEIAQLEGQIAHIQVDVGQWRMLLARPDVIVLIAERAGQSVGYLSAIRQLHLWTGGDVLNLDDLFVRPGYRDAGIGLQLMAALATMASHEQLLIRWGMEVDNVDAQRFYRRLGATLRPKIVAAWPFRAYTDLVRSRGAVCEPGEITGSNPAQCPE